MAKGPECREDTPRGILWLDHLSMDFGTTMGKVAVE